MLDDFFKKSYLGLNLLWWQNFHPRKNIGDMSPLWGPKTHLKNTYFAEMSRILYVSNEGGGGGVT